MWTWYKINQKNAIKWGIASPINANKTAWEITATKHRVAGGGASGLNAVSMIEGYASSRSLPDVLDPNTPDDAADVNGATPENWMSALFNEGTSQDDQVLTDMITENNVAPYPFENGPVAGGGLYTDTQYPGGANQLNLMQLHDISGIFLPLV